MCHLFVRLSIISNIFSEKGNIFELSTFGGSYDIIFWGIIRDSLTPVTFYRYFRGGRNFRNFTVIIVIFQAECDKQANQIVDQFLKKRQFKEKVPEILDDFFIYENEPVER